MKFKVLLFALSLFAAFSFVPHNVGAQVIQTCMDGCTSCTPSYFGYDSQCSYTKCTAFSCTNSRSGCNLYFNKDGTWCLYSLSSGGVCSSGKCVQCLKDSDCSGGKTCQNNVCACPSGTTWDGTQCSRATPPPTTCSASLSIASGTGDPCTITASVSGSCTDKAFEIKKGSTFLCSGTTDSSGKGSCPFSQSGTTVDSFDLYIDNTKKDTKSGSCGGGSSGGGSSGSGGSAGGCAWQYTGSMGSICSSGCPSDTPNQKYVCCNTIGYSQCNGRPACASYDPTKGETPCCTSSGYYSCNSQQICTSSGCQNVCTTSDKTSDLYCSKCNSCQDGIQNCGETSVDKGGPKCGQPCTIPTVHSYTTPGSYGGYTCSAIGQSKCQAYAPAGYYNIQCVSLGGCSSGQYGCWWNCQGTSNDFNFASCQDGVKNCQETCIDGGAQCNQALPVGTGRNETDFSYQVTFDYTQPAPLTGTKFTTDKNSWNCADGIDNDHDCLVDCADPDCTGSLACTDSTPPVVNLTATPFPPCTANPITSWIDCSATVNILCSDAGTGCKPESYAYQVFSTKPQSCPSAKYSYVTAPSMIVNDAIWACGYAEDNMGNIGVTEPTFIKINKTYVITVNAKATGEIDVPPGTSVKAYLCGASQYYCNSDAEYIDNSSAIVDQNRNFVVTMIERLSRGVNYKIGVVSENGYAETEFTV